MSLILLLCVAAAALYVATSLAGRRQVGPKDSVDDFSKALSALSSRPAPRRRPPARRPQPRPVARR